jgi:hypothetical protein
MKQLLIRIKRLLLNDLITNTEEREQIEFIFIHTKLKLTLIKTRDKKKII